MKLTKQILLSVMLFLVSGLMLRAQTYKEQYMKCSEIMKGIGIQDTSFFTQKIKMYDCLIGSNAPNFSVKALNGQMLELSKLKGQVVVVNFWNTGCKPCISEMPTLNEIAEKYKDKNVTFISIAPEEDDLIRAFLNKRSFNFIPVANARKLIVEDFLTESMYPYSMIIDKNGKVRKILLGGTDNKEKTFKQFLPSIDECLSQKG